MKKQILIIYHSFHHNNTEKLIRSFSDGIDIISAKEFGNTDLSKYDLVGFASGIYAGKFATEIYEIIKQHASDLQQVFLVYTSGSDNPKYGEKMKTFLQGLNIKVVGVSPAAATILSDRSSSLAANIKDTLTHKICKNIKSL